MQSIALVIHVILAVVVIGLVLMQHGKGADAGAAFGSGASATVFGARGASSFLTRMTTLSASAFFLTSVLLFWIAAHRDGAVRSVTDVPGLVDEAPAAPAPATDLPGGVEAPAPDAAVDAAPDAPSAPAAPAAPEPDAGQALPVDPGAAEGAVAPVEGVAVEAPAAAPAAD